MPKKLTNLLLALVSVGLVYGRMKFLVFPLIRCNQTAYGAFARAIAQGLPVGCRAPGGS